MIDRNIRQFYYELVDKKCKKEKEKVALDAEINILDDMIRNLENALSKDGVIHISEHFTEKDEQGG